MAKVEYTPIEKYLIDNCENIKEISIEKLEALSSWIKEIAYDDDIIGIYVQKSKSQITDKDVYELIVATSYSTHYNSSLSDYLWLNIKELKNIK